MKGRQSCSQESNLAVLVGCVFARVLKKATDKHTLYLQKKTQPLLSFYLPKKCARVHLIRYKIYKYSLMRICMHLRLCIAIC